MYEIQNLRKQFGETVACEIDSLTINDGEIIGLVGNNGAGKTTLFRMMLDLLKADEGAITLTPNSSPLTRIDISKSEEWKNFVGSYINEGFLIDYLTPEEYFAFLGKICEISQEAVQARLDAFTHFASGELFGHNKLIRNLSAGNKQKLGIIAALLTKPSTVILDEPFNFLDPSSQNELKRIIREYHEETNATILVSSHNLTHTTEISTRIMLLEHGKIIRDIANNDENVVKELNNYFETEAI